MTPIFVDGHRPRVITTLATPSQSRFNRTWKNARKLPQIGVKTKGDAGGVVRIKGLEPSRELPHSDLNAARLPIPPYPHTLVLVPGLLAAVCGEGKGVCCEGRMSVRISPFWGKTVTRRPQHREAPDRRVGAIRRFCVLYGSTPPTEFLLVTLQKRPPTGGGRALPGGASAP
jgi:hypothetical protein